MGVVIPLLIGVMGQLILINPLFISWRQSPIFLVLQNWSLGVLVVKIVHTVTEMKPQHPFSRRIQTMTQVPFTELSLAKVSSKFIFPVVAKLIIWVLAPNILPALLQLLGKFRSFFFFSYLPPPSHSWVPFFSLGASSATYLWHKRFAHLEALTLLFLTTSLGSLGGFVTRLQLAIRDEKYLVGQRLHNLHRHSSD